MPTSNRLPWLNRGTAAILLAAFLLRAFVAVHYDNFVIPDEIYQYFGAAHRLVFGHAVIPWEFKVGLRSWLIPLLLAGPMELARLVTPNPWYGIAFAKLLVALASMSIVVAATGWGWRFRGARGAVICALVAGFWPDLVVMAPHPTEGALGTYALISALYLIELVPDDSQRLIVLRRTAIAGALLGLAFVLRNPLAAGAAIAGIAMCRLDAGKWLAGVGAGAVVVLLAGMLDWWTWGTPFRSFEINYLVNVAGGIASYFGTEGPSYYPLMIVLDWTWALPVIILGVIIGSRYLKVSALAAAAGFAIFMATPHREFRFLFPSIALLVPVFALGLIRVFEVVPRYVRPAVAAVLVSGLAMTVSSRVPLSASTTAARAEAALYPYHLARIGITSLATPAYLYLGPSTRMVIVNSPADLAGVDGLVTLKGNMAVPHRFHLVGCYNPPYRLPAFLRTAKTPSDPDYNTVCAWRAKSFDKAMAMLPAGDGLSFPPGARKYALQDWQADVP